MPIKAKIFVELTAGTGAAIAAYAVLHWQSTDLIRFLCYLTVAVLSSGLKVRLPGIDGTMSVNFLFVLLGILEMSLPETLLIACTAALVQCLWNVNSIKPVKIIFNVFGMMANAVGISYLVYHGAANPMHHNVPVLLGLAACSYFFANTLPVATVISLTETKSFRKIWTECYFWSFPYYLAGAAIAGLVDMLNRQLGWQTSLLVLPPMYWIYRSYRLYLAKLEQEKQHAEAERNHAEAMAALHLRTIEALALAIEAKDHTTRAHLNRVRVYAVEIGRELGVSAEELEALRAASLLHDIGKLAVPEHIINKPSRLSPEEFEKMKIHPVVGAEILEKVAFPYPVVPIVRSHHEKWDGSGYPDGLKGEEIPIGARILATVDCLDALASDRQYRRALPLDKAMQTVAALAGQAYDPKVVEVLLRRYIELDKLVHQQMSNGEVARLSTHVKVEKGDAPAAGFEQTQAQLSDSKDFLTSIAAARQEAQTLFELSHDLGNSLSLDETFSVLSLRMKKLVPFESMAVFVRQGDTLKPVHVSGDECRALGALEIAVGQGVCGWVAQNGKTIMNANPALEKSHNGVSLQETPLSSVLAVPLEAGSGVVGVLALYRKEKEAFTADHVRILMAISSKVALCIANALKYEQAESSATTDYLTGLPNARSLFLHLDKELSRCQREGQSLAVMVCDLDGFKQVNDRFGHLEGDKLLRTFAKMLKEKCREYDYVARMGGDEFVVVMPGIEATGAKSKAELFDQLSTQAGRLVCHEDLISLSVGIAHYPTDGKDAETLLREADRVMYLVKEVRHRDRDAMRSVALRLGSDAETEFADSIGTPASTRVM